ncbi:MAG: zinc ABC transporter substrate-binding protein [Ruminococcus sp.]|nr:zinc ABC transporter substrate-binding protein [Ruminococcus sp.]
MFRKIITAAAVLSLAASSLAGCSAPVKDSGKLDVVCTIYPIYDWTCQLADADDANITYLMTSGADLHSYQPTADDIMKISSCDVFVYVGGESDNWVDGALKNARNKDMKVVDLMDVLGSDLHEEELKEGMQADEEEEEGEDEDEIEYDEHIWLSLRNAEKCVTTIADELAEADSAHADSYKNNCTAYRDKLTDLDNQYREMVGNAKTKTLIFGDRFPFRYLVDDYGLDYFAAFIGCSAESEASFETITFLANKCDELDAEYIFTIDGSNCNIANAIVSSTKTKSQKVLTLNSMQTIKMIDDKKPAGYCELMTDNLNTLKEALN